MSRFVTATRFSRDRAAPRTQVFINLDHVRQMYRSNDNSYTYIHFDDDDKVQVDEEPLTLLGPGK